jgi:hypothetical protein
VGELPPPPPGFVPPPLARFDEDQDGSLSASEWEKAREELKSMFGGGAGRPAMPGPFGDSGGLSETLFGSSARLFQLHHLWFLWYLLVFVTVAPVVATALAGTLGKVLPGAADGIGARLIRSGLAPVALGLISAPALMTTSGPFGWSLGLPASVFRGFPDFLLHFDREMIFYFLFFMAGWWLHRERRSLPSLSRAWLADLILGVAAFAAATWLSDAYSGRAAAPYHALFAFLGFFQRYLDRPSAAGRYLADTALWVYLVHQPFVLVGLAWLVPYRLPWWLLTAGVSASAVAASLLLFEAVVRPTFLVRLFGPAALSRGGPVAPRPEPSGDDDSRRVSLAGG